MKGLEGPEGNELRERREMKKKEEENKAEVLLNHDRDQPLHRSSLRVLRSSFD